LVDTVIITGRAVLQHNVNGDTASKWNRSNFDPPSLLNRNPSLMSATQRFQSATCQSKDAQRARASDATAELLGLEQEK